MRRKIRYLMVRFREEIKEWEISYFRGGVIEKAGKEHILFHNHIDDGYFYKYPVIQYKTINRKPVILSLEKGVEEIYHFFRQTSWDIRLKDRNYKTEVEDLKLYSFLLQVWNKRIHYKLFKWLPLNEMNYQKYFDLEEKEKRYFLTRILIGNILSFAKGMEWTIEKEIDCEITNIRNLRWIPYKNVKLLSMDIEFHANVSLPPYIGLGKGVSKGFGVLKWKKSIDSEENVISENISENFVND